MAVTQNNKVVWTSKCINVIARMFTAENSKESTTDDNGNRVLTVPPNTPCATRQANAVKRDTQAVVVGVSKWCQE